MSELCLPALFAQSMAQYGRPALGFNFIPTPTANPDFAVTNIQLQIDGVDAGPGQCERQNNIGFVFTEDISQLIKKYDENRTSYPDFSDILPETAAYFAHRMDL